MKTALSIFNIFRRWGARVEPQKPRKVVVSENASIKGEASEQDIAEWKRQHGDVFMYVSTDLRVAYFKRPTLAILDACKFQAEKREIKFNKMLCEQCFVGGDRTIISSEAHLLGLFKWIARLINVVEGTMGKL